MTRMLQLYVFNIILCLSIIIVYFNILSDYVKKLKYIYMFIVYLYVMLVKQII